MIRQAVRKLREDGFTKTFESATLFSQRIVYQRLYESVPNLLFRLNPPLRGIFIELTNCCNLKCKMCFRGKRQLGYMSFELFKSIVDETKGHNVGLTLHYGGESLLHPMFKTFVSYAMRQYEQFRDIGFITNGMLFSQDIADFVIRQSVDSVTFSLEGYAVANDEIRSGSKYEVVAKNIEYLLDKRTGKKPFVTINATLHPNHNESLWLDFVSEWVKKVDRVAISPCIDENFRWINFHQNVRTRPEPYCTSPFVGFAILYNGDVVPCCHDINGVQTVGNVKNEGVYEIWRSQRMRDLRYNLITHHYAGQCVLCNCWRAKVVEKPIMHNNIKIYYNEVTRFYESAR